MTTGEKTVDRGSIMAAGRREDVPPRAHGPLDLVWRVWRKRARNPTENEIERNGGGATLRHDRAKPAFDSGRNEPRCRSRFACQLDFRRDLLPGRGGKWRPAEKAKLAVPVTAGDLRLSRAGAGRGERRLAIAIAGAARRVRTCSAFPSSRYARAHRP